MATQEIEAKLGSLLPKTKKATVRQQQSKKQGRQQTGNKRRLRMENCPAKMSHRCNDCPYSKESFCDYPYIGAVKMPVTQGQDKQ